MMRRLLMTRLLFGLRGAEGRELVCFQISEMRKYSQSEILKMSALAVFIQNMSGRVYSSTSVREEQVHDTRAPSWFSVSSKIRRLRKMKARNRISGML